jgi:two-component system, NarL family, nitrate/nitrite response regulator NarL
MSNKINVVLVDDHVLVRDGIKYMLESESNLSIVAEASDGVEALETIAIHEPDLLIIDIRMPHKTGIEVVEEVRKTNSKLKIIILSMHESEEYVLKSVKAGADGYLLKGSSKEEFLKAINMVVTGGKYFTGDISSILINQLATIQEKLPEVIKPLPVEMAVTKREKEIINLLISGKGNKEIAEHLQISKRTAEVHRFNLMKKLGVKNLIELSRVVNEYALIS